MLPLRVFASVLLTAPVAVAFPAAALAAQASQDPQSVLSANGYIEYFPGTSPVIITAPHGGQLKPESMPDRVAANCGGTAVIVRDRDTELLALQMRESFFKRYGSYPHLIINRLSRVKLDPNRTIKEAACGAPEAQQAYNAWHGFIEQAKASVVRDFGKGWYMDIHGHSHTEQRVEIGYLIKGVTLGQTDQAISADRRLRDKSSIRVLAQKNDVPFAEILRGPNSLGSLFQRKGVRAIPSSDEPDPAGEKYFAAGNNTLRHGCSIEAKTVGGDPRGEICGVQLETHYQGLRDTARNRTRFGDAAAQAVGEYLNGYFDLDLATVKARSRP